MEKIFDEFRTLLDELMEEIKSSIDAHGDWSDYSAKDIFAAVSGEVDELREAYMHGLLHGRHGQISELFDVAVTALKGVRVLRLMVADRQMRTLNGLERREKWNM